MALNAGDGAILLGLVKVLKHAFGDGIEIVVLDRYGAVPQLYYPELRFSQAYAGTSLIARAWQRLDPFRIFPKFLRLTARSAEQGKLRTWLLPQVLKDNLDQFRSADLIVSAGGTYLVEHYRLELNLLQLSLAVSTGTPTVMFTQSLGPFRQIAVREWVRHLFPRMERILLRDRRSLENLVDAGVSIDNVRLAPDAAFAFADPEELSERLAKPAQRRRRVGVSVRSWSFPNNPAPAEAERRYRATITEMVTRLVRRENVQVTFVSTCQGVPEYAFDDSRIAREIVSLLPDDVAGSVVVDSDFHRPETLRNLLKGFDALIATRMHMAILSMCAGTPVLPIAYEFKTKELFEGLGLGEWVLDIESLEPHHAIVALDRFMESFEQIRADMIPLIIQQYGEAIAVESDLATLLTVGGSAAHDALMRSAFGGSDSDHPRS